MKLPLPVERSRHPLWRHASTFALASLMVFSAGFFSGALLLAVVLLRLPKP